VPGFNSGREGETFLFPGVSHSGSEIRPMKDTTFATQNRTEPMAVPGYPSDKLGWWQGKAGGNDVTF
jgi:hypothetical protein